MKTSLYAPITLEELDGAVEVMAKGKALGPNGVVMEFFKVYWELIKFDYLKMIEGAIRD